MVYLLAIFSRACSIAAQSSGYVFRVSILGFRVYGLGCVLWEPLGIEAAYSLPGLQATTRMSEPSLGPSAGVGAGLLADSRIQVVGSCMTDTDTCEKGVLKADSDLVKRLPVVWQVGVVYIRYCILS